MKNYTFEQKQKLLSATQNMMLTCLDFEDCDPITFGMVESNFQFPQADEPLSWELLENTLNSYPQYKIQL